MKPQSAPPSAKPVYPTRRQFAAKARKAGLVVLGAGALAAAGCQTAPTGNSVPMGGVMPAQK